MHAIKNHYISETEANFNNPSGENLEHIVLLLLILFVRD